jgi:hypothetical protein
MFIYIVVILLLIFCTFLCDDKEDVRIRFIAQGVCFLVLFLLVALRYKLGGDALVYEEEFKTMPSLHDVYTGKVSVRYQLFWVAIVKLFPNHLMFQIAHAFFVNVCLFVFINRYTKYVFSVLLALFLSLLYLYYCVEIQREIIAVCIFLLNIRNLENNKWVSYFLFSFLAFMFHVSALFLFIIPIFRYIKFNWSFVLFSIFLSILLAILKLSVSFDDMEGSSIILDRFIAYWSFSYNIKGIIGNYLFRVVLLLPFLMSVKTSRTWLLNATILISSLSVVFVGVERFLNYLYPMLFVLFIEFIYSKNQYRVLLKQLVVCITCLFCFCILDKDVIFTKTKSGLSYKYIYYPYVSIFNKSSLDEETLMERKEFHKAALGWDK